MENLSIRRVPLETLVPDPANPRTHDERNVAAIRASLQRFGQSEPLILQAGTNRIIAGHGRLEAMRSLGWNDVDVVELPVDSTTATALGIALNRTGELAGWDDRALAALLQSLPAIEGTGFDAAELDALVKQIQAEDAPAGVDDPGPGEPPEVPVSKRGDLWVLGDHLLLCGDSTDLADVQRVMGTDRASLVATDPPYLVEYTGERPNDTGKDWSATYHEIDIKDADGFFRAVFTNVLTVLAPKAAIYTWHAHKRQGLISRIWEELGILDHQQVVWIKPTPVFGRVYWHFQHEPCMLGWKQGEKPEHDGKHEFSSVWAIDYDGKNRIVGNEHPMQKPVELYARPMRKHTQPGDIVYEPFSGSGTQIIAAETLARRCRAIEIEPTYVDVAIERWQTATGKVATLDGQTFEEVRRERSAS